MIDNIIKIDNLKTLIEKNKLNIDNLRVCLLKENHEHFFFTARVILTIPKDQDTILRCEVARKVFNSAFMSNESDKEYRNFKDWCDDAYATAKECFGEDIIQGSWNEEK